jgi:hypothetical protein
MSWQSTKAVWAHSQARGSRKMLLLAIAQFTDRHGRNAWPSIATLSEMVGVGPRAITDLLKDLEAAGDLAVERVRGRGLSNNYTITLPHAAGNENDGGDGADGGKGDQPRQKGDQTGTFSATSEVEKGDQPRQKGDQPRIKGDQIDTFSAMADVIKGDHSRIKGDHSRIKGDQARSPDHRRDQIRDQSKEKKEDPPTPRMDPAKVRLAEMVNALVTVTGMSGHLNWAALSDLALDLLEGEYTAEQLVAWYGRGGPWYQSDWRGQRNEMPGPFAIRETIMRMRDRSSQPPLPGPASNGRPPPADDALEQRRARLRELLRDE